jgi:hypothetical protein
MPANITKTHTDDVLQTLLRGASARAQRSLKLINRICREQVESGFNDLKYATIGRLSEKENGPGPQAIRNKSGSRYRDIIAAWSEQASISSSKKERPKLLGEDWVNDIDQPHIRWLVSDIQKEIKELKNENNLLKSGIELNVDLRERIPLPPVTGGLAASLVVDFSSPEARALHHAISSKHLVSVGLRKGERGEILNENDSTVFKPGFVTAIEKILVFMKNR